MADLTVTVGDYELEATWTDDAPETRQALGDALPLEGQATRWGDELYLFWGPTPASREDEPRAASPVNVVAQIEDVSPLSDIEGGAHLRVEANRPSNRS